MKRLTTITFIVITTVAIVSLAMLSPILQGVAPSTKTVTTTTTQTITTTTATTVNQISTTTFAITVEVDRTDTVGADRISTTIVTTRTSIPVRQLVIPNQTEGTMNIAGETYWFTDSDVTGQKQSFELHGVKFTFRLVPLHFLEVVTSYNEVVKTTGSAGQPISSYKYEPYANLTDDFNGYQAGVIWIFGVRTIFLVKLT